MRTRQHEKTYKMACAPSEDSNQPGLVLSLIRVFTVHSVGSSGPKLSSCGQRRLWSDWADAQAGLSLRWAHMLFCRLSHALAQLVIHSEILCWIIQCHFSNEWWTSARYSVIQVCWTDTVTARAGAQRCRLRASGLTTLVAKCNVDICEIFLAMYIQNRL